MPSKHTKVAITTPTVASELNELKVNALIVLVVEVVGEKTEVVVLEVGLLVILVEVEELGT